MHRSTQFFTALGIAASVLVMSGVAHAQGAPKSNQFFWPDQLDFSPLRQHAAESNPLG